MNSKVDESTRLVIAFIGKPVGLKGQLKLHPQCDFLEQFKAGSKFYTNNIELIIESFDKTRLQVKFVGYDTIEKAKELSTKELFSTIEESRQRCKLASDEYFWFDIIGSSIFESDVLLGTVEDIDRFTNQDYLYIKTSESLVSNGMAKSFLLPYSDRYILTVDIKSKYITVNNARDILEAS